MASRAAETVDLAETHQRECGAEERRAVRMH
jgi:hypothetical protein